MNNSSSLRRREHGHSQRGIESSAAAAQPPEALPEASSDRSPGPMEPLGVIPPALSAAEAAVLNLSMPQKLAIEKLLSGHSVVASALAAGVTRMTIYNWLRKDAKFQAAYNAWQMDALTNVRAKLLAMSNDAALTVSRAVRTEPKVALAVLKALGTMQPPTPGSTDPEEVAALMEVEEQEAQNKLDEAKLFASVGFGSSFGKPLGKRKISEVDKVIALAERELGGG